MNNFIKSQGAQGSNGKTFYVNCFTTTGSYIFFNSGEHLAAGNDMISGSSFGVPVGTVPTNQVNLVLAEMPINNAFLLEKIRIKHIFSATPENTEPIGFFIQQWTTPVAGNPTTMLLDNTKVVDPEDEQSLIYEYDMNLVVDGQSMLAVSIGAVPAGYTGYTITFYISAIADVYNMQS